MTSEDLRSLLPAEPNGAPATPGWYIVEPTGGHATCGFKQRNSRSFIAICTGDVPLSEIIRHAPLRLFMAEDADRLEQAQRIGSERGLALTMRCAELDAALRRAAVAEDACAAQADRADKAAAHIRVLENGVDALSRACREGQEREASAEAAIERKVHIAEVMRSRLRTAVIAEGKSRASCAALREALLGLRDAWQGESCIEVEHALADGAGDAILGELQALRVERGQCLDAVRGIPGAGGDSLSAAVEVAADLARGAVAERHRQAEETERANVAEAACAAMRMAIVLSVSLGSDGHYVCCGGYSDLPHKSDCKVYAALAPDAGRALLAEVESLRTQAAAIKTACAGLHRPTDVVDAVECVADDARQYGAMVGKLQAQVRDLEARAASGCEACDATGHSCPHEFRKDSRCWFPLRSGMCACGACEVCGGSGAVLVAT